MKRGPHILMTTDAVGGVWVFSTTLAQALAKRGFRVTLVTLGPRPRSDQTKSAQGENIGLVTTDLALEWMDPAGDDLARARDILMSLERRLRPDVIHLNGYREGLVAWSAPVLLTAHSCVQSWWRACRAGAPAEPRWALYAENAAAGLAAADAWAAPTCAFHDCIAELYRPPTAGMVICNGVATVARRSAKQPRILAAGRIWDEAKNLGVVAAAAEGLSWPLYIAGRNQGPDGCAKLPSSVVALGELPHSAMARHFDEASIFVAPALYEPFGLAVLEAASAACALVLSDIPSFRELWNGAALFVDPRDERSVRAALVHLCRETELRRDLAAAARGRARRYTLAATSAAYALCYERLLTAERGVAPPTRDIHAETAVAS